MQAIRGIKKTSLSMAIVRQPLLLLLIFLLPLVACGGGSGGGGQPGATAVEGQTNTPTTDEASSPEMTLSINQLSQDSCPYIKAYVSVTDASGQPLEALTADDFSIFAGGEPAEGIQVQWAPEVFAPVSVSFVMDYSGSMDVDAVEKMEAAATSFVDRMAAEDWGEVIKFSIFGEIVQAYTPNKEALKTAISDPWALSGSATMLYDAVQRAVADTAQRDSRRAVLAITDGIDNASQHTLDEVIAFAGEQNVPVFTVGLNQADADSLAQLAAGTGGRYFYAPDPSALADIYVQLASLLEQQYVISYRNGAASDLEHTLEVIAESEGQVAGDILTVDGCPAPPVLELSASLSMEGSLRRLDREADHLYLANGSAGLAIVNVSDPTLPVVESELATLADATGFTALDVAVAAPYAFIAAGERGLIVADVSVADTPSIVATVTPEQIFIEQGSDQHLTAFTEVAVYPPFVFTLDEADGFAVFYFQDLEHIYYSVETGVTANRLWVSGRHLYLTTAAGLSIYDISDPSTPDLDGQANVDGGCDAITFAYPYAYLSLAAGKGVVVVDVSLASAPQVLGTLMTEAATTSIGVRSGFALAGTSAGDLNVLDVRQPQAMERNSQLTLGGSLEDLTMTEEWAYVAAGEAGLQVLKISR
jgi:VWFA-related protein